MEFRTKVQIPRSAVKIAPCQRMLFVGSCFADSIGRRFQDEQFRATVNPYGVMYNPASVLHTIERWTQSGGTLSPGTGDADRLFAVITLGTNHVYREKSTGEIVDNCQKRPQNLFSEEVLSVEECHEYLRQAVETLRKATADRLKVIVTVSPIRYRKYGYHESQLSKAVLLLAADRLTKEYPQWVDYFPAYELMNDELRDYRFYQPDMLHPSQQAVEYIYEQFAEAYFAAATAIFLKAWRPLREALGHRPFDPESADYKAFRRATMEKIEALRQQYPDMATGEIPPTKE